MVRFVRLTATDPLFNRTPVLIRVDAITTVSKTPGNVMDPGQSDVEVAHGQGMRRLNVMETVERIEQLLWEAEQR